MSTPKELRDPQLNPVAAAMQRDANAPMPGNRAKSNPVDLVVNMLFDGEMSLCDTTRERELAINLREYNRQQQTQLKQAAQGEELATRQFHAFVSAVAAAVDLDADTDADSVLAILNAKVAAPTSATLDRISETVANALGAEEVPEAFTVEDWVRELVERFEELNVPQVAAEQGDDSEIRRAHEEACKLLGDATGEHIHPAALIRELRDFIEQEAKMRASLRQQAAEVAEAPTPTAAVRALVSEFGGSLDLHPLVSLREILQQLKANQKEPGWDGAVKTLVDSNKRYENVLATIKHTLDLA